MAEVWSGWHAGRDDRAAIKIVTRLAGHAEHDLDAFFHEVRTVASLGHPGIVQILDYGLAHFAPLDAQVPYLVTELARGGTLAAGWRAGTFGDVRRALLSILEALGHAHARGVIHRDLKPGNVLRMSRAPDAPLKVTDFGIARLESLGERSYADDVIAGTPKYMAPEQIRGDWRDHGPWTDLYAVGCLAWTMVTGRPPFDGDRDQVYASHLEGRLPPLTPIVGVPDEFVDWLHWLLEKDIADRCDRAVDAAMELVSMQVPDNPQTIEVSLFPDEPSTSTLISDELLASSLDRPPPTRVTRLRQLGSANHALTSASIHTELRLWGLRRLPFVGRREQRTELWNLLQRAFDALTPQLVTLAGAPGTGKSALAQWLAERSHELGLAEPMLVVHDPISRRNDGLRGAFIRTFRLEDLGVAEAVGRLRAWLARHLDEPSSLAYAGALGDWCAADDGDSVGGFESAERASAVLAVLRCLGRTRVPLIWIDDVNRATHTLETLTRVVRLAGDQPLRLMVVTTGGSHEPTAALEALASVCQTTSIELSELTADETRELIDEVLPLAPAFRAALIERTGGNPLFAMQMIGALISRDELAMNDRGEFEIRDSALPASSFTALFDLRVASLGQQLGVDPDAVREQLEIAAALGGTVRPVEWLVASEKRGVPVRRDLLDAMVRSGLAVPVGGLWSFAHDLVRAELIASAKRRGQWALWNLLCADALDDLYPRPDPERRASHLIQAEHWSLAVDASIAAAEAAFRSNAVERARGWLDAAESALASGALPADDVRRAAVRALRERISDRFNAASR